MITSYWLLLGLCISQRLVELVISRRNQQTMRDDGFALREADADFVLMLLVHVGWFLGLIVEPLLLPAVVPTWIFVLGILTFVSAQILRIWVLVTLGSQWNIRIMSPLATSNDSIVTKGPYRWIRHPNYTAVILEFASLPLVGGAYLTWIIFSILNGFALLRRIPVEEASLCERSGYQSIMMTKPRFFPWG